MPCAQGVGTIHHELLDGRVARAIHVDASTAHLTVAREETERRGHGGCVEFMHGDFVAIAAINLVQRLKRSPFRAFLHDPSAVDATLRAAGLEPRHMQRTLGWEVVVYERRRERN